MKNRMVFTWKVCRSVQSIFFIAYYYKPFQHVFVDETVEEKKTCTKLNIAAQAICFNIRILASLDRFLSTT